MLRIQLIMPGIQYGYLTFTTSNTNRKKRSLKVSIYTRGIFRTLSNNKMEDFSKIAIDLKPVIIFTKRSILDVWQGSKYASQTETQWLFTIPINAIINLTKNVEQTCCRAVLFLRFFSRLNFQTIKLF